MASNPPCAGDIFKNGDSVALLDARSNPAEAWVKEVAKRSGQKVDWHYSGGIANVLFIGDRDKVIDAIESMPDDGDVRVMTVYREQHPGPYRAGVTEAPDEAVAAFVDPFNGETAYIIESKRPPWWRRMLARVGL